MPGAPCKATCPPRAGKGSSMKRALFRLLLPFFFLLHGLGSFPARAAETVPLFTVSLPEQVRVCQKTTLTLLLDKERAQGAIPSVAVIWKEKPQGEKPTVLVGAPETVLTFKEPGRYVFDVELTLVYKNSCALASTGDTARQTVTVVVGE